MPAPHANIHHFNYDPASGDACYDEEGEPMFGYYYEIVDGDGRALSPLMGPYNDKDEVEAACNKAWDTDNYKV